MRLKYNGNGRQHIIGVPARDLDEGDLLQLEYSVSELVTQGLYTVVKESKPKKITHETGEMPELEDGE